jgi:hypothetical protein
MVGEAPRAGGHVLKANPRRKTDAQQRRCAPLFRAACAHAPSGNSKHTPISDVADRVPALAPVRADLKQRVRDKLVEVADWRWPG